MFFPGTLYPPQKNPDYGPSRFIPRSTLWRDIVSHFQIPKSGVKTSFFTVFTKTGDSCFKFWRIKWSFPGFLEELKQRKTSSTFKPGGSSLKFIKIKSSKMKLYRKYLPSQTNNLSNEVPQIQLLFFTIVEILITIHWNPLHTPIA